VAELMTISQRPAQLSGTQWIRVTCNAVRAPRVAGGENTTGLNMNRSDLPRVFFNCGAVSLISRVEDL
jgi:hypothetical protein